MAIAWLALGSNRGYRARYLEAARAALRRAGIDVRRVSRVVETDPVGVTDQPPFLNQVLEVETSLSPRALLERVKGIEHELGRTPAPRWGPRQIDIDILLYDELVLEEPDLKIPHPELERRPFLLNLLMELDPHRQRPVARTKGGALLEGADDR